MPDPPTGPIPHGVPVESQRPQKEGEIHQVCRSFSRRTPAAGLSQLDVQLVTMIARLHGHQTGGHTGVRGLCVANLVNTCPERQTHKETQACITHKNSSCITLPVHAAHRRSGRAPNAARGGSPNSGARMDACGQSPSTGAAAWRTEPSRQPPLPAQTPSAKVAG